MKMMMAILALVVLSVLAIAGTSMAGDVGADSTGVGPAQAYWD